MRIATNEKVVELHFYLRKFASECQQKTDTVSSQR